MKETILSIVVLAVIVAVLTAVVVGWIRRKKNGTGGCSCGCGGCALRDTCHPRSDDTP